MNQQQRETLQDTAASIIAQGIPAEVIIDDIAGHRGKALTEVPQMADLRGLPDFLQDLKNQGMHPFLTGDITQSTENRPLPVIRPKPYIVAGK